MQTIPRSEHPAPQFTREHWLNLNGAWAFELDQGDSGLERHLEKAETLADTIIVPFCPESALSGVRHTDFINACWYRRTFTVPDSWQGERVILHFGAVNYESVVFVNGKEAIRHIGGYTPFSRDITHLLKPGENTLHVYARSDVRRGRQVSGKQSPRYGSFGCYYTRTTGIWQTVWLEGVPEHAMTDICLTPDAASGILYVTAELNGLTHGTLTLRASFKGSACGTVVCPVDGRTVKASLKLEEKHLWDLDDPALYDLTLTLDAAGGTDTVQSYFGLRSITWDQKGFLLNGRRLFLRQVLDQGFNPEGVITAPDDEQLKNDIVMSKALGFNGARLHQKVFEPRTLYWADHLGYLLWDELGNWGMDVSTPMNMPAFLSEWLTVVRRDRSAPSLMGYCPFNETQRDTDLSVLRAIAQATKLCDPTRALIDTSGYVHCDVTDVYDYHDYEADPEKLRENLEKYCSAGMHSIFWRQGGSPGTENNGQPVYLSEFGGIGFVAGDLPENKWGYGGVPTTKEDFFRRFDGQMAAALQTKGLCGFCYTQLTDVEQEMNGLITYDRKFKFDPARVNAVMTAKARNEED